MKRYIDSPSLTYRFLRLWIRSGFSLFFRRIEYRGQENIPVDEPVIFAPNHQAAMVDALAVLCWQRQPVVFMARANMFKNPTVARLLRIIKMMPIYRIRDGYSNLSKNEEQMDEASGVLLRRHLLCLMPEGTQWGLRRLRPLVKGMFRIALPAQQQLKGQADIKIVPVGIDYTEYEHPGADITVTYGRPLSVSDYLGRWEEDPQKGMQALREDLSDAIIGLIQHIPGDSHYGEIYELSYWIQPLWLQAHEQADSPGNTTDARREITRCLNRMENEEPENLQQLIEASQALRRLPGNACDKLELITQPHRCTFLLPLWQFLLATAALPGHLLNWPLRALVQRLCRMDGDPQMFSTYRIAIGSFGLPFCYLFYALLATLVFRLSWPWLILLFLLCLLAGMLAEKIRPYLRKLFYRSHWLYGRGKKELTALRHAYSNFNSVCRELMPLLRQRK
ncbi:MAG: 1-acyl-sn-glycerol-3-phosphate acyltransferase [Bacteroidales bacterium]|nr:1-acyl-sn-glycerol-3-phosphate acyltransferase [Bacteroidales bacterium]